MEKYADLKADGKRRRRRTMNRHSHRRKKISARVMALSMAAAMAVTVYPVPAFAEEGQNVAQKVQVLDKTGGNIHDYG